MQENKSGCLFSEHSNASVIRK